MPIPAQVDEKFGRGGNGDRLDEGLNDSELDSEPLLRPPPDSVLAVVSDRSDGVGRRIFLEISTKALARMSGAFAIEDAILVIP